ncbi:type VI secretion system accessory protein TagJ [Kosakonia pseudosacchari]|uniref:type VI secretion system accessory protein TagJ n=1 Tax=Kosakonia pseudosacchari TaxID=1646340 RepID=UPI0022F0A332|nr:type VI secretion system accessory protein TagJ [Kosakonia pseudosacchari]WBU51246.1 type VI secretion system accessory protein TagJ [Kosakonia pseudosacchari]
MNTLFQQLAGESLQESLAQLESRIRTQPGDADLRAAFAQLLCLDGNWSRALAQLKSWQALKPQAQPTVTLLEQAIEGERQRAEVMAGRARPVTPDQQWPWLTSMVSALDPEAVNAGADRETALEMADANPGQLTTQDGQTLNFDWLMDGDCRFGPVCEAIVNGRYFWLPFSAISAMQFQPPASVTDLVWRHTLVRLQDGSEQVCQIPARYPLDVNADDRFKLCRVTEWQQLPGDAPHYIGQGQKVWLNDSAEYSLLDLATLSFNVEAADE